MTPTEITLVRQSFDPIRADVAIAVGKFFRRLLVIDPDLAAACKDDFDRHCRQFGAMVDSAVHLLDQPARLPGALAPVTGRIDGGAMAQQHFASVGNALLQTLENVFGPHYSPDLRDSWFKAYREVVELLARTPPAVAAKTVPQAGR